MTDLGAIELNKSVLSLAFDPPIPLMNSNPLRIYYALTGASDVPKTFDPNDAAWTLRRSSGDRKKTNDLLNLLQDARIKGTPLIDYVIYEHTPMWQFLPAYTWLQFFLAVDLIDLVKDLIQSFSPATLRFFPTGDPTSAIWESLISEVGRTYGLKVYLVHEKTKRGLSIATRNLLRNVGAGRFVRLIRNKRNRSSRRSRPNVAVSEEPGSILFLTFGKRHWVPVPGEPNRMHDEQMYPLLPALRNAGWRRFVMIDSWDLPDEELARRVQNDEPDVLWRAYSSYRDSNNLAYKRARPSFSNMWKSIRRDKDFYVDFQYRGIHLLPILRTVLERSFHELLPECAQMLDTASRMIRTEHAGAVIASYETGPWARAVLIQAARIDLPTIGLQHGMIFEGDPDNLHLRVTTKPDIPGFMVPHVTCVWGPLWKDVLTKAGHYPIKLVAVTGNWRYDRLSEIKRRFDVDQAKRRYGVDPNKKVVLFLSVGLETVRYLRSCLDTIANREDLAPLIKLHPGVDKAEPVIELLRELGKSDEILVKGQLIDALLTCDLVVSQYSTAISEAAMVDKPVIMANFQRFRGGEDYIQSGICLHITDSHDLLAALDKALYDPSVRTQMTNARGSFIQRYFYRLDGHSAERVVDALESVERQISHAAPNHSFQAS
jgi:hypothetical protein